MDLDDQADEAWLLSVQRKLYQWSGTHPEDSYRDVWNWITDIRNLRCAWQKIALNKGRRTAGVDRFLACLRHVHGFPVFGLLRRLRPLDSPSPVSVASPTPSPGGESGFPCSSSQPSSRRWHTLPLAMQSDDLGGDHRR
jgi:hypothetical protein